jgi:hypothetical protein
MLFTIITKRYATIDTETQGGGEGGHQSLTQKSDPNFILLQNATVSPVGIPVQFSAMHCAFQVVFHHIFPLWEVAGGSFWYLWAHHPPSQGVL